MLFIPVLILGIVLYMIGHRVSSVLIFFFFALEGFQIVPEFLFNTYVGISKGIDFALIYTIVLFIFGLIRFDDFIPINPLSKVIFGYLILLFACIGMSIFYYKIPITEVIKTCRLFVFFLVLSYFIIRRLDKTEFQKVIYVLLFITVIQCILFAIQAVFAIPILTNASTGGSLGFIKRFYNYPKLLYLFSFLTIFTPIISNKQKSWIIPVLMLGVILPLSRSAILIFLFLLFVGALLKLKSSKQLVKFIPVFLIAFALVGGIVIKQIQGRTMNDIQSVINGEFIEVVEPENSGDSEIEEEATMIFRMALFFERYLDVIESRVSFVIGKGLSAEGSPYTNANFDYNIGLAAPSDLSGFENYIAQLYSPDISWSNLILRYGIVGTIIYTLGFCYLAIIIYKKKNSFFSIPFFLLSCFILMNSLSSDIFFSIVTFLPFFFFFDQLYYEKNRRFSTYPKYPKQTCL